MPHRAIAALAIVVVGAAAAAGCAGKSHAGAAAGGGDAAPAHPPKVHRPVATACPMTRPPGNVTTAPPAGDGSVIDCASEADCTAHDNGRCTRAASGWGTAGARCSYDECFDDAKCGGKSVCACRGSYTEYGLSTDGLPNVCTAGNCLVDADCGAGGYCSPSYDTTCANVFVGWFCHTPHDDCVDAENCADALRKECAYERTARAWVCVGSCGAG